MLRRCSTASAYSDCVVLLCLAGVVRINWYIRLLSLVFGLLPLEAIVIVLVRDRVLQAGVLLRTPGLSWVCRLLRALLFADSLLLSGGSCCYILVVLSTLGISVRGTLGICVISLATFLVIRLFSNVCGVCTIGDAWVCLGFFTACYVSFISCCSSSAPSFIPMFLMVLLQSAMVAIILSAWVMLGFVMFWWLNWAVSMNISLLVVLMWHKYVR